jgi:hypothetical protein
MGLLEQGVIFWGASFTFELGLQTWSIGLAPSAGVCLTCGRFYGWLALA